MPYPHNEQMVSAILAELEPRILGRELRALGCICGNCTEPRFTATAIIPGGQEYHGMEAMWGAWSVIMMPDSVGQGKEWAASLNMFLDPAVIVGIFVKHFGAVAVS